MNARAKASCARIHPRPSSSGARLFLVLVPLAALLAGCADSEVDRSGTGPAWELLMEPDLLEAPANVAGNASLAVRGDGARLALTPGGGVRSPDGRTDARVLLFGEDGAFLSELDRQGAGPGEYGSISALAFEGDSLWVFDRWNGRIDLLDPDLEVVRSIPHQGVANQALAHPEGGVVFAGRSADGSRLQAGRIRGGEVEILFEERVAEGAPAIGATDELRVAVAGDGIVVARSSRYDLRHVSEGGSESPVPVTLPAWWPDAPADPELAGWTDASPQVLSLAGAGGGQLWVQGSFMDLPSNARALIEAGMADPEGSGQALAERVRGWARIVTQRVDLESGEVLEESIVPGRPIFLLGGGFAYSWDSADEDPLFEYRLRVWRMERRSGR